MGKKRRPFINKSKSVTFKLVSRPPDDPLFADESAPNYVLVEKKTNQTAPLETENNKRKHWELLSPSERKAEQAKYGVYFDDEYNYLQHLLDAKDLDDAPKLNWEVHNLEPKFENLDNSEFPEMKHPEEQPLKLMLPSSVFETSFKEKDSLAKRAALPVGPQLHWDPDLAEGLDDDFDCQNPDNQLDDDFVIQAMGKDNCQVTDFSENESYLLENINEVGFTDMGNVSEDDNLSLCGAASGSDFDDNLDEEARDHFPPNDETLMKQLLNVKKIKQQFKMDYDQFSNKSASTHFTEYSLSSSVVPRSEQLKTLDEKFEQMFIREYGDEDAIGALDNNDELEDGNIDPNNSELMASLVEEYQEAKRANFGLQYVGNSDSIDFVRKNFVSNVDNKCDIENTYSSDSSETDYEEIQVEDTARKGDKERFDCESILSTYSNTNYHPKVLHDTDRYGNILKSRKMSSHIRFNSRNGMPIGVEGPVSLTTNNLARLDQSSIRTDVSRLTELSIRPRHETLEEKRVRKKELKEYRSARRIEKKANRIAFGEEKVKLHKAEMNAVRQKKIDVI